MTEQLENAALSTLAGAVNASQTSWPVVNGAGFPPSGDFRVVCEKEYALCTGRSGNVMTVQRGVEGSAAAPHASGKDVVHVLTEAGLDAYVIPSRTIQAAGDIIVGQSPNKAQRLGIGAEGQVLRLKSGMPQWITGGENWWSGPAAPAAATGEVGDWWLNSTTGDYSEKTAVDTWVVRGNLKGPQGIQGIQGPPGAQGPAGPTDPRLGTAAYTITNWNNANQNGWWMGADATNAPGAGWYIGIVTVHNPSWITQDVWQFTSGSATPRYTRRCLNGAWEAWSVWPPAATGTWTAWQNLALSNGWVNYGGSFAPAQAKRDATNNLVLLRGLVNHPSNANQYILVMPQWLPSRAHIFSCITSFGASGSDSHRVDLQTNGILGPSGWNPGGAGWICLDGIIYGNAD